MPVTVTSTIIANRAIQLIGNNQQPVTGVAPTFDDSASGIACAALYDGVVQTVARQYNADFSRNTVALVASGNVAPFPWDYEYLYPTNGILVRQVMPTSTTDSNNPLPTNWVVANNTVGGVPKRVIQTNLSPAQAVFTNQPTEDVWDAEFVEAVVRLLASELAMAISGKPDTSRDTFEQAAQFKEVAASRRN